MTHARKVRPFLPALSVAAALAAGAVQAQAADDLRRVPLCSLPLEMPLPASVLDRIRAREDFEDLLRYSSDNCPETALVLADGATASIGGATAGAGTGGMDERRVPVCRLEEEWPLSARALTRIRNGADFEELLRYASESCPEVALLLADSATATIPDDGGDGPDDGVDSEGPEDRRDPPQSTPEPETPEPETPEPETPEPETPEPETPEPETPEPETPEPETPVTDGGDNDPLNDGSTGQTEEEG